MTDANRYPAQVFWSDEDAGFVAIAPDLPGCSAFGNSQQEALTELQAAIAAWIEAARSAGNPIPEPSDPARAAEYSGKVLLRMPRDLHGRLATQAKFQNVSLNHYIVYLLTSTSMQRSIEGSADAGTQRSIQAPTYTTVGSNVESLRQQLQQLLFSWESPHLLYFTGHGSFGQTVTRTTGETSFGELTPLGTSAVMTLWQRGARHG